MKHKNCRAEGFTLVEIMIVVGIVGALAAIAVPNFLKSRATAQRETCINNLRQIEGAIQSWALEMKKSPLQAVTYTDISVYLRNAAICPAGGTSFDDSYLVTTVNEPPTCQKQPATHVSAP